MSSTYVIQACAETALYDVFNDVLSMTYRNDTNQTLMTYPHDIFTMTYLHDIYGNMMTYHNDTCS